MPSSATISRSAILPDTSTQRTPELDGLRGIAILFVLVFHLTPPNIPLPVAYFVSSGWLGVDLFFVLSGYLITGILIDSAGSPGYYRNFILRRTLRIFPLYYLCLLIACIMGSGAGPIQWKAFLNSGGWWYAGFLGNIQVVLQNKWPAAVLIPLWSLQIEEQFYLTFPLVVALSSRKTLARLLMGAVILAPLLRIALIWLTPTNGSGAYVLMPCRMDTLAMGGLIAIARRDYPAAVEGRWVGWVTALSTFALVFICWKYGPAPWGPVMRTAGFGAAALMFGGILVLLMVHRNRALLVLCRVRVLAWIGGISYGIYLLHIPTTLLVRQFGTPLFRVKPGGFAEAFLSLGATIGAALLSWKFFESPILRLRSRFTVPEEIGATQG